VRTDASAVDAIDENRVNDCIMPPGAPPGSPAASLDAPRRCDAVEVEWAGALLEGPWLDSA
jgi:hypothetical protein